MAAAATATADANLRATATAKAVQYAARATATAEKQNAEQEAFESADRELRFAMTSVENVTRALENYPDFAELHAAFEESWSAMQAQYQSLRQHASVQPLSCPNLNLVKAELHYLEAHMNSLYSIQKGYEAWRDDLHNVINTVQRDMDSLRMAEGRVEALIEAFPSRFTASHSADEIDSALTAAQTAISKSNHAMEKAQEQTSAYISKGQALLDEARALVDGLRC